jgi:hypothetical protein
MSAQVFTVSNLLQNLSKVNFSELKKQQSGWVSWINMNSGGMKRIYVKTPKMFAPFGASNYNPQNKPELNNKFQVALSFKGADENEEVNDLKKLLRKLDNLVINKCSESRDWMKALSNSKKKISKEVIESQYYPVLKKQDDDKYPPLVNLKALVKWEGGLPNVGTKVYNTKKELIDISFDNYTEVLPKLSDMKCVFQVASVWFINKKFGLTLKLIQSKIYPKMLESLADFALDDEDEEEGEELNTNALDSDEESEDESDE